MVSEVSSVRKVVRGRVADQIFEDLREQILGGRLPDGAKLPAERELAAGYGVSGATVREAVRVLTAMGLVSARHGSGSYVRARADTLVAASIASVVQLERASLGDLLDVLVALRAQAAALAARRATVAEVASLREVAEQMRFSSVEDAVSSLRRYYHTLSAMSHNPLLTALCGFLMDVQLGVALELSEGRLEPWKQVAGALHGDWLALVEALAARDPDRAVELIRTYHARIVALIDFSSRAREIHAADPGLSNYLSSFVAGRVRDLTLSRELS